MESGASAEIRGVGNEGVVGISLFMGGDTTPSSAVVQAGGHGLPAEGRMLKQEFDRAGMHAAPAAALHPGTDHADGQTAACNRHHSVEQQTVPLAAAEPRPAAVERTGDDAGTDRRPCWACAAKASPRPPATCSTPASSATAAATSPCSTARSWRPVRASATPCCGRSCAACGPTCSYGGRRGRRLTTSARLRRRRGADRCAAAHFRPAWRSRGVAVETKKAPLRAPFTGAADACDVRRRSP